VGAGSADFPAEQTGDDGAKQWGKHNPEIDVLHAG
jgi:hypothetical protein